MRDRRASWYSSLSNRVTAGRTVLSPAAREAQELSMLLATTAASSTASATTAAYLMSVKALLKNS